MILVIGANPTDGHPVFASRMKKRLRQGARLIVADPRRTDIVRSPHVAADHHLQLKPGSNVALLNAMAHVVVTEGLVDEDYVRTRCDLGDFEIWARFVADERHSPEASQDLTGVPAAEVSAAARLYATGGKAAIYYGLGVTEHSQGSTTVMAMANLAMATGNIGHPGAGVNPLRGQNNVQGSCDMGSFPHELPGYRHVSDDATRDLFEALWGVELRSEPGLRIPNMLDEAVEGRFRGLYIQGEDPAQSDPDTQHVTAGLAAMDCVVVQDLFLNETAKYAHVFLPGSSFLEKDGTFTNAERRISRVRKVMAPLGGLADWEVTCLLAEALGLPMRYTHPSEIMDEIAALTPTFAGVSYEKLDALGSIQWPCNAAAPDGTPTMHVDRFVRGLGKFMLTEYVPTEERTGARFPLILTTGRILSQYNVGAQTRRTENSRWHEEDRARHPSRSTPSCAASSTVTSWRWKAARAMCRLKARISERMQPGDRLHDIPPRQDRRQRHHHRPLRLGDQLPGIQGDGRAGAPHEPPVRVAGALLPRGREPDPRRPRRGGVMAWTARGSSTPAPNSPRWRTRSPPSFALTRRTKPRRACASMSKPSGRRRCGATSRPGRQRIRPGWIRW